jgi:hypothetical protein
MKMIAEYLEHALQFEKLAEDAHDPVFKESLLNKRAYRKLAGERAQALKRRRRRNRSETLLRVCQWLA